MDGALQAQQQVLIQACAWQLFLKCYCAAFLQVLINRQQQAAQLKAVQLELVQEPLVLQEQQHHSSSAQEREQQLQRRQQPVLALASAADSSSNSSTLLVSSSSRHARSSGGGKLACLSLALPIRVDATDGCWC